MRTAVVVVACVLLMAGAVLYASESQRSVANENFQEAQVAKDMAVEAFRREDALHDFLRDGSQEDLLAVIDARRRLDDELARASDLSDDAPEELRALRAERDSNQGWERLAQSAITRRSAGRGVPTASTERRRDELVDDFTAANRTYQQALAIRRDDELRAAALVPVELILVLSVGLGAVAAVIARRGRRVRAARVAAAARRETDDRRYAAGQARFAEAMQVAEDQSEGHALLVSHLGRAMPRAAITVLVRNNSADRLEPAQPLPDGSPLAEPLEHAKPRTCLAVRLSRRVDQGSSSHELMTCDVCGRQPGESTCQPLLVGGEVIGSVLTTAELPATDAERRNIQDSVSQAAPVLANLRNLAVAERRAATDALTGLPNRRAIDDHLKRLLAQAGRSLSPVSAILLDLDHFKDINDTFGHERGDETLAALGALLRTQLRGSDFAGRSGGEEFLILLPDTDRAGALRVAEHVRQALHELTVVGVTRPITASFGIATCPDDARDGDALLRLADRALYAAKRGGRDRVEVASTAGQGLGRQTAPEAAAQPASP